MGGCMSNNRVHQDRVLIPCMTGKMSCARMPGFYRLAAQSSTQGRHEVVTCNPPPLFSRATMLHELGAQAAAWLQPHHHCLHSMLRMSAVLGQQTPGETLLQEAVSSWTSVVLCWTCMCCPRLKCFASTLASCTLHEDGQLQA
jgi:hypothetical protein